MSRITSSDNKRRESIRRQIRRLLNLKGIVCPAMIEIVTQASNDEREAFDFTEDLPPLCSLKAKERLNILTFS